MEKTIFLALFCLVSVVEGKIQKVYPYADFSIDETSGIFNQSMRKCDESEIEERCSGYNYALVEEVQSGLNKSVTCFNSSKESHLTLGVSPIEVEKICQTTLKSTLFGAFSVGDNNSGDQRDSNTLLVLDQHYPSHEYFTCLDQRVLQDVNVVPCDGEDDIIAVYINSSNTECKALTNINSRVWDFSGNCHTRLYPNEPFPIGHSDEPDSSVAVYCKNVEDCRELLQPAVPAVQNNQSSSLVDFTFRQNKCIYAADLITNVPSEGDEDLSELHGGNFSCVQACNETGVFAVALIADDKCYCSSYNPLRNVMVDLLTDDKCQSCLDNSNFTCGADSLFSVYNILDDYGVNAGYKYFQCVNAELYNDPKELLDPNLIEVTSVDQATECLIDCKSKDFGIAMISKPTRTINGSLECTCIKEGFYNFAMQDLSSRCLVKTKDESLWWCPDLDGPCMNFIKDTDDGVPTDVPSAVVYCLDDSFCNANHILATAQDDICSLGVKRADPDSNNTECLDTYFKCVLDKESMRVKWEKQVCLYDQLFSPDQGSCTDSCNPEPIPDPNKCTQYDDALTLWTAEKGQTETQDCKKWRDDRSGNQTWTCNDDLIFDGDTPNRSECEEDWINEIDDQVSIAFVRSFAVPDNFLSTD